MILKKLFLTLFLVIFIPLISIFFINHKNKENRKPSVSINNHLIYVEIADTDEKKALGLSGRTDLPESSGMLFIFPKLDFYTFWMKGMNFPLDFVWIKGDVVTDLTENVPPPIDKKSTDLPLYKPKKPVDKVLEINAGAVKNLDIKVGDKVVYNLK